MRYSSVFIGLLFLIMPCMLYADISGTVLDSRGDPVKGALVRYISEADEVTEYRGYTDAGGSYTIDISVGVESNRPASFSLGQNYPNPFNPGTTIPFSLDTAGRVTLTVYNITGQRIRTLVDEYRSAGHHTVQWDGTDETGSASGAGLYIYHLRSGHHKATGKMLLIDGGGMTSDQATGIPMQSPSKRAISGTFTLIIEADGIIPYHLHSQEIHDGGTYNYTVPREDDEIKLGLNKEPGSPFAALMASPEGDSFGLTADKDTSGEIQRITGALYITATGETFTVWFGDDGLPEVAVCEGWTILFTGYSGTTADMTIISPEGDSSFLGARDLDTEKLAAINDLATDKFGTSLGIASAKEVPLFFNAYVEGALRGASLGMSLAGCLASSGLAVLSAGSAATVALLACRAALLVSASTVEWMVRGDSIYGDTRDSGMAGVSSFVFNDDIIQSSDSSALSGIGVLSGKGMAAHTKARENYEQARKNHVATGRVVFGGAGHENVMVEVSGGDIEGVIFTGSDGYYSVSLMPGTYTFTYSAEGYYLNPDTVIVEIDDEFIVDTITASRAGSHEIPGIAFAAIPRGTYRRGDIQRFGFGGENPVHEVILDGFEMSIYETTNGQYAEYLNAAQATNDIEVDAANHVITGTTGLYSGEPYYYFDYNDVYGDIHYITDTFTIETGKENFPVYDVTWYGAKAFAYYYGLDLPTEAEWEYACRAGTETLFNTGNDMDSESEESSSLDRAGWYWYNSDTRGDHPWTHEVGKKEKNAFGLYDMHGNVWEWCNDWYARYTVSEVSNHPTGPVTGSVRVIRGGSWSSGARNCRSASRYGEFPSFRYIGVGFRVIRR